MIGTARSFGGVSATVEMRTVRARDLPLPLGPGDPPALPFGLGRSYGDVCLVDGGILLSTTGLDRILAFDRDAGVVCAEAGVTLGHLLDRLVPEGRFLPVVPGTRHVTVGGAIANDVHGKNAHRVGSFGRFVRRLEVLRSDGTRRICGPGLAPDLFRATVGGLGLTGLVTWAELEVVPIPSGQVRVRTTAGLDLEAVLDGLETASEENAHAVAWLDLAGTGRAFGRGLVLAGDFVAAAGRHAAGPRTRRLFPFGPPRRNLVAPSAVRAMNRLRYHRGRLGRPTRRMPWPRFFHPLDAAVDWHLAYGPRGFFQHQSVLPPGDRRPLKALVDLLARSDERPTLAVLKTFGAAPSPGILSFTRPGLTLALDLPDRGESTRALLDRLDAVVRDAGGALYPAKDARMSAATFRVGFPRFEEMLPFLDPAFGSRFWRRVAG